MYFCRISKLFSLVLAFSAITTQPVYASDKQALTLQRALQYIRSVESNLPPTSMSVVDLSKPHITNDQMNDFINQLISKGVHAQSSTLENFTRHDPHQAEAIYIHGSKGEDLKEFASLSNSKGLLIIGTDGQCAIDGVCALSVNTESGVEVLLNEKQLERQGYTVDAVFKLMVRQVGK